LGRKLRCRFAAAALTVLFTAAAQAADMPGEYLPPPLPEKPAYEVVSSGWYIRGDVGGAWGAMGSVDSAAGYFDPVGNSLGSAVTAGIGVGIKSRWLRTDVTLDYLSPMKYSGSVLTAGDTTARFQATSLLFNGYFDLGTWRALTPYIGAGIGAAALRVSDYASTGAPPFSATGANNTINLAFAAMAGVAWNLSSNLAIDFGYRYLNAGDISTKSDAFGAMTFRNVAAHEARVGLRWSFDELRYY
jgi:opacity protein-like surface antigen